MVPFKELLRQIENNECGNALDLSQEKLGFVIEGEENVKALAEALAKNTTLTSLELYHQNIGSTPLGEKYRFETFGPKYIAQAIEANKTLTSIGLARNHIGIEGVSFILIALRKNFTIASLDLSMNPFLKQAWNHQWLESMGLKTLAEDIMDDMSSLLIRNRINSKGKNTEVETKVSDEKQTLITTQFALSQELSEGLKNVVTLPLTKDGLHGLITARSDAKGLKVVT